MPDYMTSLVILLNLIRNQLTDMRLISTDYTLTNKETGEKKVYRQQPKNTIYINHCINVENQEDQMFFVSSKRDFILSQWEYDMLITQLKQYITIE